MHRELIIATTERIANILAIPCLSHEPCSVRHPRCGGGGVILREIELREQVVNAVREPCRVGVKVQAARVGIASDRDEETVANQVPCAAAHLQT